MVEWLQAASCLSKKTCDFFCVCGMQGAAAKGSWLRLIKSLVNNPKAWRRIDEKRSRDQKLKTLGKDDSFLKFCIWLGQLPCL